MASPNSDPEVERLLSATRSLVTQAHRLSQQLDATVDELEEYIAYRDRRFMQVPIEGEDRRARPD